MYPRLFPTKVDKNLDSVIAGYCWHYRKIKEGTMSESKKKSTAKPVKTVRQGAIAASIWKRQASNGFEYYDFTLSRSWKTQSSGREGYSPNFFSQNAAELQSVIQEAASWIAGQQASLQADQPEETSATTGRTQPTGGANHQAF